MENESQIKNSNLVVKEIEEYIEDVWPEVLEDIRSLVAIPSISTYDAFAEGAPFGKQVRIALDCALEIAEKLGYETGTDEGYVGFADIPGKRDEQVATICHVDVVPAGPGWSWDPFHVEQKDGWLIGRGVVDDKGPAILSLYAGAFFLKKDITPKYSFRSILGCDEEIGMSDVHHYLKNNKEPDFLFTPDAEFPVCNAEKGQLGGIFRSEKVKKGCIESLSGAEATNAIPSQSVCILNVDEKDLPMPNVFSGRLKAQSVKPGRVKITAHGIGGHASMPKGSLNAIKVLVSYLQQVSNYYDHSSSVCFSDQERQFLNFLEVLLSSTDGSKIGIATSNEAFGPLTLNAGTISIVDGVIEQTIDIRFPDSITSDELVSSLTTLSAKYGVTFESTGAKAPFSVSADDAAVQVLINTYNEVMGKNAKPFSMGGGTYARQFSRAVSFGPEEPGIELPVWGGPMHGPNEVANIELMKKALKIYIIALLRLNEIEL